MLKRYLWYFNKFSIEQCPSDLILGVRIWVVFYHLLFIQLHFFLVPCSSLHSFFRVILKGHEPRSVLVVKLVDRSVFLWKSSRFLWSTLEYRGLKLRLYSFWCNFYHPSCQNIIGVLGKELGSVVTPVSGRRTPFSLHSWSETGRVILVVTRVGSF